MPWHIHENEDELFYIAKGTFLMKIENQPGSKLKKAGLFVVNKGRNHRLVGLIFGKWYDKFNIQGRINIGIQNITEKIGENDPDWVQLKGWSQGLIVNHPIKIRKSNPVYYYGAPSLLENNLNIHLSMRYIKRSLKEATGLMVKLGFSYRMSLKGIKEYKLKDEFLNK